MKKSLKKISKTVILTAKNRPFFNCNFKNCDRVRKTAKSRLSCSVALMTFLRNKHHPTTN